MDSVLLSMLFPESVPSRYYTFPPSESDMLTIRTPKWLVPIAARTTWKQTIKYQHCSQTSGELRSLEQIEDIVKTLCLSEVDMAFPNCKTCPSFSEGIFTR